MPAITENRAQSSKPKSARIVKAKSQPLQSPARTSLPTRTTLVPRALAAGIDLGVDEPEDGAEPAPAHVRGIALLLREALLNLIDNAIRYAGRGATVTVRVRREGRTVRLEVEDNGPGVPEAEREHVFERFVRATSDGTGCGLGLAIVREIVERHAGRVMLRAAQPAGVVACVTLPAM